ncbi:entericidin, EcnA/B family [Loktanella sp. D2R18]|nr:MULTISPECIES: entericidin A/B family lipoprotein [Rhodobacterales]MDO6589307.1 entericidin A/B family lipoprotein [Yoonia sp. 1_MG-2023]RBW45551.1 entericidin, EcnA/B family [Loktanella sp. D2R18]
MHKILIPLAIAVFTLSACETVQGAGQDISNAGDALTEESQDVQNDM